MQDPLHPTTAPPRPPPPSLAVPCASWPPSSPVPVPTSSPATTYQGSRAYRAARSIVSSGSSVLAPAFLRPMFSSLSSLDLNPPLQQLLRSLSTLPFSLSSLSLPLLPPRTTRTHLPLHNPPSLKPIQLPTPRLMTLNPNPTRPVDQRTTDARLVDTLASGSGSYSR